MHKGHSGSSMGGRLEMSKARRKKAEAAKKRTEQRWAKQAGKVAVRYACICPREGCQAAHEPAGLPDVDHAVDTDDDQS